MESVEDLRLAELLCSRLCHDLSGPVGAAAAGAELLAESGGDAETLELVSTSASAASARLSFLRAAFGFGVQPQRTQSLRTVVEKYFGSLTPSSQSPLELEWDVTEAELPAEAARLLLNLVMTARDALPRGGSISVSGNKTGSSFGIKVMAKGEGVRLSDDAHEVLVDGASATGPRGAQAGLLKILSVRLGADLLTEIRDGMIVLSIG